MNRIELGVEVRDRVSGFKGTAMSRHEYLHGCERISVQPPVDSDGKLPDTQTFDVPSLEVVGQGSIAVLANKAIRAATGGPERYSDTGRR